MTDLVIVPDETCKRLLTDQHVSCAVTFIDWERPGSHLKQHYFMRWR